MKEKDLYDELVSLTKDRDLWKEQIPFVISLLANDSVRIRAKAI